MAYKSWKPKNSSGNTNYIDCKGIVYKRSSLETTIDNIISKNNTQDTNISNLSLDYIREYNNDVDYGWQRRTWKNSRIGECWKQHTFTFNSIGSEGSLYYGDVTLSLPNSYFSNKPTINITCEVSGGFGCYFVLNPSKTSKSQIGGWIFSDTWLSNRSVTLHIHCVGL